MHISELARKISPSMTLSIADTSRKLRAQGVDIISFATGEPDFDTPQIIKNAATAAMNAGATKYSITSGLPELKAAIIDKLKSENRVSYKPAQLVITNGAKQALYELFLTISGPEDEVLVPIPCWVSYAEQVKLAGAEPVAVGTTLENDFQPLEKDLEAALTPRTRSIIINSPCNPTGAVYSRKTLEMIAAFAVKHNLYVIADEVYEKMLYDDAIHYSIASLSKETYDLTIIINSLSKTYAMTGWRVGYAAGPEEIIKAMVQIQGHITGNVNSFVQKGAVCAMRENLDYKGYIIEYKKRRDYIISRLNAMKGIRCSTPKGAFYVYPDISALLGRSHDGKKIDSARDLCNFLIENAHIATVPGEAFIAPGTNIRLTYAISMEQIKTGMDRMEAAIARLE